MKIVQRKVGTSKKEEEHDDENKENGGETREYKIEGISNEKTMRNSEERNAEKNDASKDKCSDTTIRETPNKKRRDRT